MERGGGGWQHFTNSGGLPSDIPLDLYRRIGSKRSLGTLVKCRIRTAHWFSKIVRGQPAGAAQQQRCPPPSPPPPALHRSPAFCAVVPQTLLDLPEFNIWQWRKMIWPSGRPTGAPPTS